RQQVLGVLARMNVATFQAQVEFWTGVERAIGQSRGGRIAGWPDPKILFPAERPAMSSFDALLGGDFATAWQRPRDTSRPVMLIGYQDEENLGLGYLSATL